ncbi:hypothetical protein CDO52_00880 [Nocardiopsis gilva YIM 90087]|uniref:Uncharacterized protein n=1 Tax=Nocardiopsis gilva YIM 90087 TaxID=1235441 RepID=A0A223S069_9ACTN|nr:hypothetical protein [Nocardiopsis gilva]ASU81533.1 hypothetical protein CDO52_00880 [Nocardiopsis gilva YIM 90087]
MAEHRRAAERELTQASEEPHATLALVRAQIATAHALLALLDAAESRSRGCDCEACDDWPMAPQRPINDIVRPDLFGDAL